MIALLAAFLLFQESPADFLKKVEEKYASAKTLSVTAEAKGTGSVRGRSVEGLLTGSLRAKGEGSCFIEFAGKLGEAVVPSTVVTSDGKKIRGAAGDESKVRVHAQPMGKLAREGFVRAGLFGVASSFVLWAFKWDEVALDKLFQLSGIADGGTEKVGDSSCRIVRFTLTVSDVKTRTTQCKLWIDAEKLVILKRELTREGEVTTETYANTVFDAEIADDQFKIP